MRFAEVSERFRNTENPFWLEDARRNRNRALVLLGAFVDRSGSAMSGTGSRPGSAWSAGWALSAAGFAYGVEGSLEDERQAGWLLLQLGVPLALRSRSRSSLGNCNSASIASGAAQARLCGAYKRTQR